MHCVARTHPCYGAGVCVCRRTGVRIEYWRSMVRQYKEILRVRSEVE